jgi:osmoprotectant transport system permease protein
VKQKRITQAGIGIGLISLALPFVTLKPNRLVQGTAYFAWNVLSVPEIAILVLPWVALIVIAYLFSGRDAYPLLAGAVGDAVVIIVFFLLGMTARRMMMAQKPFARVSMGVGCLGLLTGSYILIINGFQKGAAFGMLRYAMVFSSLAAVVILLGTGHLNELSVLKEFAVRKDRFFQELGLHVQLAGTAVLLGVIIGTPLGMWAFRSRLFERPIFFVVNSIQTIPSLALFGLMIAPLSVLSNRFPVLRQMGVKGIGGAPALIALTLYALLPITRNTYTSLSVVEPSILEAARGMGMNRMQLLRNIQVPLSLPIILSGIRISMVQAIGNTTVAALIGAGGFGVFVFQGLGQAASDLILLGTIPVIALAVFTDRIMQFLVTVLTPEGIRRAGESVR